MPTTPMTKPTSMSDSFGLGGAIGHLAHGGRTRNARRAIMAVCDSHMADMPRVQLQAAPGIIITTGARAALLPPVSLRAADTERLTKTYVSLLGLESVLGKFDHGEFVGTASVRDSSCSRVIRAMVEKNVGTSGVREGKGAITPADVEMHDAAVAAKRD